MDENLDEMQQVESEKKDGASLRKVGILYRMSTLYDRYLQLKITCVLSSSEV